MSFLIAALLALPAQADTHCLPSTPIVGELSEIRGAVSTLDALLASSSGAERALGEALEVLLVAAESGEVDVLSRLAANVFARVDRVGLSAAQYEMAREIVDDFRRARSAADLGAALASAQDRLGVEPTPQPAPRPMLTPKADGEFMAVMPPDLAGHTYSSLIEAQQDWEASGQVGPGPIEYVTNDYEGGYRAGAAGFLFVMGQPGSYSKAFFDGFAAGDDSRR